MKARIYLKRAVPIKTKHFDGLTYEVYGKYFLMKEYLKVEVTEFKTFDKDFFDNVTRKLDRPVTIFIEFGDIKSIESELRHKSSF